MCIRLHFAFEKGTAQSYGTSTLPEHAFQRSSVLDGHHKAWCSTEHSMRANRNGGHQILGSNVCLRIRPLEELYSQVCSLTFSSAKQAMPRFLLFLIQFPLKDLDVLS